MIETTSMSKTAYNWAVDSFGLTCRATFTFVFLATLNLHFVGTADAKIDTSSTIVSDECQFILEQNRVSDFQLEDDESAPTIVVRPEASDVSIKPIVFDVPFFQGIMVTAWDKQILHCWDMMEFAYFVLAEQVQFYNTINQNTYPHVRVHLHNRWNCGNPCISARVHTINLINGPYQPNARMVYQSEWGEYPSRWFRVYLTKDELVIFDRIIEDG